MESSETITKRIKDLIEIRDVQCQEGNWDVNEYMRGLANGLIMEDKDPIYKDIKKRKIMDILDLWFGRKRRTKIKGDKDRKRIDRHQRKVNKSKRSKVRQ